MESETKKKFYPCDPDKNKECNKKSCKFELDVWGPCEMTTNPDYAFVPTKERPMTEVKRRINRGGALQLSE